MLGVKRWIIVLTQIVTWSLKNNISLTWNNGREATIDAHIVQIERDNKKKSIRSHTVSRFSTSWSISTPFEVSAAAGSFAFRGAIVW